MNATDRLLDQAKRQLDITSDYALAKHWKLTAQRISLWRRGDSGLSDDRALQICEMIGADPGPVLIELQAERARKSGHSRVADALESLLRKVGAGITAAALLLACFPAPADAAIMPAATPALFRQHLTDNANYAKLATLFSLIYRKVRAAISGRLRPRLCAAL